MNDLPPTINTLSEPIIITDDTSVVISSKNVNDTCMMSNTILSYIHIYRGIFVTERRSGSPFSEERKPEQRSGTFFPPSSI
jgi:hypothetical protein